MTILILKITLIITLIGIIYQDLKNREVFLWLLLMVFLFMGVLYFINSKLSLFLINILFNFGIVGLVLLILMIYSKLKLKTTLRKSFGFGDLIFFLAIAVGFPITTFLILFSFSLFFSLIIFLMFKKQLKIKTVPLAGLQAIFIGFVYLLNWSFYFANLYQ